MNNLNTTDRNNLTSKLEESLKEQDIPKMKDPSIVHCLATDLLIDNIVIESKMDNIKHAALILNSFCEYYPQLKLENNIIVSVAGDEQNPECPLPNSFQLNVIANFVINIENDYKAVNFLTYAANLALYYPGYSLYELELLAVSFLLYERAKRLYEINNNDKQ